MGDFVIMKAVGVPAFNFAVTVDDCLMEITHVIRAIFRKRSRQKIPVGHFITLVDDLAVSDLTMRKLQRLPWMQQTSSAKLPVILFEVGAIGFEARKRSYQPYEVGYDLPNFEIADNLYLAPLLAEAVE